MISLLACGGASATPITSNNSNEADGVVLTATATGDETNIDATPTGDNKTVETSDTTDNMTVDDLINEKIMALECEESIFMQRLTETSKYINLEQSSFHNKRVVLKEGYVETTYYVYKKSLEMSARFLRDFPCLETLTVMIPLDGELYKTQVEIDDYEKFLGIKFETLRTDIKNWRALLASIDKSLVQSFASKYITQVPMSEIDKPMVSASENNINIRSGPSTDYNVIGTLSAGKSLPIIGRNADSSWWQVTTSNGDGWIAGFVVTVSNVDDSIPVIDVPPPSSQSKANTPGVPDALATTATPVQEEAGCNPNARITSPAPGAPFTSRVVAISGYANVPNFNYYKIEYSTDPDSGNWNYLLEKDTPIENDVLMYLETSTVPYGPYGVRLTVVDMTGNYPEPCIRWFNDNRFVTPEPNTGNSGYTPDTSGNAPCLCDFDRYNCNSFGSSWAAQQCYNYCVDTGHGDVHDLDRDRDGQVCEWLN